MIRSIRWRLVLGLGAVQAGSFLVAGVIVWASASRSMTDAFDARITAEVRALASILFQVADHVELEFSDELMPQYSRLEDPHFFQVWVDGEGVLERSHSLGELGLSRRFGGVDEVFLWDQAVDGGGARRMGSLRFPIHHYYPVDRRGNRADRKSAQVVVAANRAPLDADLAALARRIATAGSILVVACLALTAVVVRAGLAPLRRLGEEVARVEEPGDRPELGAMRETTELAPVVDAVHAMMERIDAAFGRERRLSSNIAHELRTPIAELRTMTDVALGAREDTEGMRETVEQAQEIAAEMDRTVRAILRVWRREGEQAQGERRPVELTVLVEELFDGLEETARQRGLRVEGDEARARVLGDTRSLALTIGNLARNAVAHATRGGWVRWRTEEEEGRVRFVVENAQEGLREADRDRVLEPFWTGTDGAEHSGLGLSLTRTVCEAAGYGFGVEVGEGTFRAWVEFERAA